jgi:hypothetical protein
MYVAFATRQMPVPAASHDSTARMRRVPADHIRRQIWRSGRRWARCATLELHEMHSTWWHSQQPGPASQGPGAALRS